MPALQLKNEWGDLVGGLLIKGDGPKAGAVERDCVLMPWPSAESVDDPMYQLLRNHSVTEFRVRSERKQDRTLLEIDLLDGWHLAIELEADGKGSWGAVFGEQVLVGQCEVAKKGNARRVEPPEGPSRRR